MCVCHPKVHTWACMECTLAILLPLISECSKKKPSMSHFLVSCIHNGALQWQTDPDPRNPDPQLKTASNALSARMMRIKQVCLAHNHLYALNVAQVWHAFHAHYTVFGRSGSWGSRSNPVSVPMWNTPLLLQTQNFDTTFSLWEIYQFRICHFNLNFQVQCF